MRCLVKYLQILMTCNTSPSTCKKKPLSSSSLLARSSKLHGRLGQLCGCFFVRGIFSGVQEQARRVRCRSWYTIYSCACVALVTWIWADTMASWTVEWSGHRERIDNSLHITIHTLVFFRVAMNCVCMLSGSTKLVSIYQLAYVYEKRTGLTPCECCSTQKIFWADVRRCCGWVIYAILVTWTEPQGLHERKNAVTQTIFWINTVPLTLFWLVYDTMYSVALKTSAQALCMYLEHELQALTFLTSDKVFSFNRHAHMARRIEEVRLNVFTVIRLKRAINDIWVWSLLATSVFTLVVPCICMYEACYAAYAPEQQYATIIYTTYVAYEFFTLALASQCLINGIERLHDSIDPNDMAFEGAGFFTLSMSLLVSMAASVITYAVILQQTTQSLKKTLDTVV
ncbi:hypothetical protein MTO96_012401 [Rhipicephalus appendiculatus]